MENKIKEEILKLKKEKDFVIIAHNYQIGDIQDVADFVGDSLELSRVIKDIDKKNVIFAGVRFMAETAKILSPEKNIILPVPTAGCEMADMVELEKVKKLKEENKNAKTVCYVNTTALVKSICDICCTSANAVKVVNSLKEKEIIFLPDKNLASFVRRSTDKKIIAYEGFCYVHNQFNILDVKRAREKYPKATLMIHPEAPEDVQLLSDVILSTGGMVKYPKESKNNQFIVGTEEGMIYRLQKLYPDKKFFPLREKPKAICNNMKKITLKDILLALKGEGGESIFVEESIRLKALKSIEKMIEIL
ncbi:MAG: quinolinate synthase NadA [bacterium]|nr:quinolinate synthase NadA [bacterium]